MHPIPDRVECREAVLDAYIIEEIKRHEEARRRAESDGRPRVHIEREQPPRETPEDQDRQPEPEEEPIRIDIEPTFPIRPTVTI